MENAEEIITTPDLHAIDIGPLDLAQSMRLPDPEEVEWAVEHVVDVAIKAGKPVGVGGSANPENPGRIRFWWRRDVATFWVAAAGSCST